MSEQIFAVRRVNNFLTKIHFSKSGAKFFVRTLCGRELWHLDTILDYDAFKNRKWRSLTFCKLCKKKVFELDKKWQDVIKETEENFKKNREV